MEALLGGSADIGTSSRNLTQEEKDAGAVENIVAKDGISVIANPAVTGVTALTSEQIAAIYTGKITNWSEVGGRICLSLPSATRRGSGTRDSFEEILGIVDQCHYAMNSADPAP